MSDTQYHEATPTQIALHRAATERRRRFYPTQTERDLAAKNARAERELAAKNAEVERLTELMVAKEAELGRLRQQAGLKVPKHRITYIKAKISDAFGISSGDIDSNRRETRVTVPRQAAAYLARELTPFSYPELGRLFGRDHTTILFSCRKTEARMRRDAGFCRKVADLHDSLKRDFDHA